MITRELVIARQGEQPPTPSLEDERRKATVALGRVTSYDAVLSALVESGGVIHTNYYLPQGVKFDGFMTADMWGFTDFIDHDTYHTYAQLAKDGEVLITIRRKLTPPEIEHRRDFDAFCWSLLWKTVGLTATGLAVLICVIG
jgi:hypothetical protein